MPNRRGRFLPFYPVRMKDDPAAQMAINEDLSWLASEIVKRPIDEQLLIIRTVTSNDTPSLTADEVILVDTTAGNITINLPTPTGSNGKTYRIKRLTGGVNTLSVATVGAETIDGAANLSLPTQYDSATLVTDGTNWHRF